MEVTVSTNKNNSYSVSELIYIRDCIENMRKFYQVEALRILHKNSDVVINENKNGVHINLTDLKTEILDELNKYITYVKTQENNLDVDEQIKDHYRNTYFAKDIKDNNLLIK